MHANFDIKQIVQYIILVKDSDHCASQGSRDLLEQGWTLNNSGCQSEQRLISKHLPINNIATKSHVQILQHNTQNALRYSMEKRTNCQSGHPSPPSRLPRHRHSRPTKTLPRTPRRQWHPLIPIFQQYHPSRSISPNQIHINRWPKS
jgi:hypothetical protein